MHLNRATIATLATAGVAMAGTGVAQADAAAPKQTACGSVYTQLYGYGRKMNVNVSKTGPVGCRRARVITASIYGGRGHSTWHCAPGTGPNCSHAEGWSTSTAIPGWRFWTGPGGGSASSKHARVRFYYLGSNA